MNTPTENPGILEKLSEHNIGTRISWRRDFIALLLVTGLLGACTNRKENSHGNNESALQETQNRIDMLGCELWEMGEINGELSKENAVIRRKNAMLEMRVDTLLLSGKQPPQASAGTRPVYPGDLWSDDPEIFRKAYNAEFDENGEPKLDPALGWEILPKKK